MKHTRSASVTAPLPDGSAPARRGWSRQAHVEAQRPRKTIAQLAEEAGIHRTTYSRRLKAAQPGGPVLPSHASPQRVIDALQHTWSANALMLQDRLTEALVDGETLAVSRLTLPAGIATDKVLLMAGRPTALVMQVHAHRLELGAIAGALSGARAALGQPALAPPALAPPLNPASPMP